MLQTFRWPLLTSLVLALGLVLISAQPARASDDFNNDDLNGVIIPVPIASGVIELAGVAQHADFRKWQLDLLLDGDADNVIFLAVGEEQLWEPTPLVEALDTTIYPNGDHRLRLRVVRSDTNYDEYFTNITFRNISRPTPDVGPQLAPPSTEGITPTLIMSDVLPGIPPREGRWIEIDVSEQTLSAWEGDQLFMHTVVSTGKRTTPTVMGDFAVTQKYEQQRLIGPDYNLPNVPGVMYFFSNYAIHGAYWHDDFGTPVSHGCVNMQMDEVMTLFEWADYGTDVVVHE